MLPWPEKVRAALLLTAENVEGNEGSNYEDGRDGVGVINGASAVAFAQSHTTASDGPERDIVHVPLAGRGQTQCAQQNIHDALQFQGGFGFRIQAQPPGRNPPARLCRSQAQGLRPIKTSPWARFVFFAGPLSNPRTPADRNRRALRWPSVFRQTALTSAASFPKRGSGWPKAPRSCDA